MTRCSYIPPEGQSIIAIAQERGGTTDGDIQALIDRFRCKAEARWLATEEDAEDSDVFSCADHLGHLLDERWWWSVRPLRIPEPADITIEIVHTQGVAREGFGSPTILAPAATATPIVDLGTNPTREQLEAAGFCTDNPSYREARAAFGSPVAAYRGEEVGAMVGCFAPAPNSAARINATACLTSAVRRAMAQLMEIHGAIPANDAGYRMVLVAIAGVLAVPWSSVEIDPQPPGFRVTWNGVGVLWPEASTAAEPPPYAVGDVVEWRTGPLDQHWRAGRVTTVVDDRPNDGVDKPFWIVRVDTAGERRFASAAVIGTCLRPFAR